MDGHQSTPQLLNDTEVARLLTVPKATLAIWRSRRPEYLPFVKLGRHVRYRRDDVLQFIERNMRGVTLQ